jgi:excisionase family DNA binding protein
MPLERTAFDSLIDYAEAARLLQVPEATLRKWVSRGQIPHHRLNLRSVRFNRDELLAWSHREPSEG